MTFHDHNPTGSRSKVGQLSVYLTRTSIPRSPILSLVFNFQRYGINHAKTYVPLQKAHSDSLLARSNRPRRLNNSHLLPPTLCLEFQRVCPSLQQISKTPERITNTTQQIPHPRHNLPLRSHLHRNRNHTPSLQLPKYNHIPYYPVRENGYLARYAAVCCCSYYCGAGSKGWVW